MAEVATAAYDIEPVQGDLPGTQLYKACVKKLLGTYGYQGDRYLYQVPSGFVHGPGEVHDRLAYNLASFQHGLSGIDQAEHQRLLEAGTTLVSIQLDNPYPEESSGGYVAFRPIDLGSQGMPSHMRSCTPEGWDPEEPVVLQRVVGGLSLYQALPEPFDDANLFELHAWLNADKTQPV